MLKRCAGCGGTFDWGEDWRKLCGPCFLASPKGKAWKAKKDAEKERQEAKQDSYSYDFGDRTVLDPALLRKLLQLCHPDRHGNSELATAVTQQLLKMRG